LREILASTGPDAPPRPAAWGMDRYAESPVSEVRSVAILAFVTILIACAGW